MMSASSKILSLCLLTVAINAQATGKGGQLSINAQAGRSPFLFDAFKSGEEGYACYRIPVLLRLPDGNIALFAEGRKFNCDDQGWVDVVFKISTDNGRSFGPLHRLYGEGTNTSHVTIGNPAPVSVGGKVVILFCRNNQRLLTMSSTDAAGLVWPTTAVDITETTFANASKSMACNAGALEVSAS
jgi:hypothetical protein